MHSGRESKSRTMAKLPSMHARCNGVFPSWSAALISAYLSSKSLLMATSPEKIELCKGVWFLSSLVFTSASMFCWTGFSSSNLRTYCSLRSPIAWNSCWLVRSFICHQSSQAITFAVAPSALSSRTWSFYSCYWAYLSCSAYYVAVTGKVSSISKYLKCLLF